MWLQGHLRTKVFLQGAQLVGTKGRGRAVRYNANRAHGSSTRVTFRLLTLHHRAGQGAPTNCWLCRAQQLEQGGARVEFACDANADGDAWVVYTRDVLSTLSTLRALRTVASSADFDQFCESHAAMLRKPAKYSICRSAIPLSTDLIPS
jgi:hypothetical protein